MKEKSAPLAAVARHFSARLEQRGRGRLPKLTIDGTVVSLQVLTFAPKRARDPRAMKPGLRFDRVALGVIRRLRVALEHAVPDDRTIVVAITAPIRQAAKTAAALAERIDTSMRRRSAGHTASSICGNRVQIWILRGGSAVTARLVGFVHNPDTDPAMLVELTGAFLGALGPDRSRAGLPAAKRWLVIENAAGLPIGTYRNICQQLRVEAVFGQVLVTDRGAVEKLSCG